MTSKSSDAHWLAVYRRAPRMGAPLFVDPQIAAAYREAIAGVDGPGLLLGVTPQLADFATDVTAVERNPSVIAARWPGDTSHRRAVLGDWRTMAFEPGSFALCIGDGSLNSVPSLAVATEVLTHVAGFLRPGARVAIRLYLTPDTTESVPDVFASAQARRIVSFSAFKWRLAMAMVQHRGDPSLPVADILAQFEAEVPDRDAFATASGIPRDEIDAIDIYRNSAEVYCFPTAAQVRRAIPDALRFVRFAPSGTYELSERCPIAIIDRP